MKIKEITLISAGISFFAFLFSSTNSSWPYIFIVLGILFLILTWYLEKR